MTRKSRRRNAIAKTTSEFASHTTIHGIGYIFDHDLSLCERALWICIVVTFLASTAYLSVNTWTQWREDQVITTLKQTTFPITEVNFPAITICGSGFHMDNVKIAASCRKASMGKVDDLMNKTVCLK